MKMIALFFAVAVLCTSVAAQAPATAPAIGEVKSVPVKDEPHHHFALENPYIRLYNVAIPANSSTLVHRHEKPYIFVAVGSAEFTNAVVGKEPVHSKMSDGEYGYSMGGFAHQVKTDAGISFNNIDVELLQPQGQPRNLCDKVVSQDFGQCDLSRADQPEGLGRVREQGERRGDPGGDQQRLGDRGVPDRVGVRFGAVVQKIEIGDGGPPDEAVGHAGHLEPGREEAGCLGTLAGSDEYEHPSIFRAMSPRRAVTSATKIRRATL